jgi:hypothetical protein
MSVAIRSFPRALARLALAFAAALALAPIASAQPAEAAVLRLSRYPVRTAEDDDRVLLVRLPALRDPTPHAGCSRNGCLLT